MRVAILTIEQKDTLVNQEVLPKLKFNPVQDINGDWIISEKEISDSNNPSFSWIKSLDLTDWLGPYVQPII
jgi:hypothetical protein